jgi:anaerobic selenocysteine-containing dehydrogenase
MYFSGHCRLCPGVCGVVGEVDGDRLVAIHRDPDDPVSRGQPCAVLDRSLAARESDSRLRTPMRRENGALVPCSWEEALDLVGESLGGLRSRHGVRSLGLFLGPTLPHRSTAHFRSLALGIALGTPHVFSASATESTPLTRLSELMLGQPTWLLPDVGRAHYVLLFGDHDDTSDWAPALRGRCHLPELRHSQKTKGTKLVCVGPRRSPLADEATQHVAVRPGTEGVFLLGMLVAAVRGGWGDHQYLRDYTRDRELLDDVLAGVTVEACAAACGVPAATLSGVALKFSRSAMAVAVPGPGTFSGPQGGIAAWAWLALHTLTANTLRPGGLYDHEALLDLQGVASGLATDQAPVSSRGQPLHLLQLPGDQLSAHLEGDDEHRIRGMIVVEGDPASTLPGSPRVRAGLENLDCLVVLASHRSPTTELADVVLPVAHPWEETELELVDQPVLPRQILRHSAAFAEPVGQARPMADALAQVHRAVHPGLRGGVYGLHLGLLARAILGSELESWLGRLVEWGVDGVPDAGLPPGTTVDEGPSDRALWRVGHDDQRIHLVPDEVRGLLSTLALAAEPDLERPLSLWTTRRLERAPDAAHRVEELGPVVFVHPEAGFAEGALVRVETAVGSVAGTVVHDERLRPDVVCVPRESAVDAMALLAADAADPLLGTLARDGAPCAVQLA